MKLITALSTLVLLLTFTPATSRADEGMWLFESLPVERIRRATGVQLTDEWLEHVRKASLRFDSGGSGSFVGPGGLAITNHHVARGGLVRLSTPQRDILTDGYLARTRADELKMPDLAVRALWTIEDVTERVKSVGHGKSPSEAEKARRAEIASIETHAQQQTGLECEVVPLYNGGLYHLYSYKRWTDVRLVWAPEAAIADFGGDVDNFRYPRFCLDATIVRVYEDDGEPVSPEHYLEFTQEGVEDGQPTFVSGHPGSTRRLLSVNHLAFLRDHVWPMQLGYTFRREVELKRFAEEKPEHATLINRDLPGIQNWRKALDDRLRALQTPLLWSKKQRLDGVFRIRITEDPELSGAVDAAYDAIDEAQAAYEPIIRQHFLLGGSALNRSDLFGIARMLVRRATELEKPSGDRLPEYADARISEIDRRIMTEAPIEPALERHRAETWLGLFAETWGAEHPLVAQSIGVAGAGPRAVALVEGSRLADTAFREELMAMGLDALEGVSDPMLRLAFTLEPASRALIDTYDDHVVAIEREAYDTIADARFMVFKTNDYPDATFTLRLSYGRIGGFEGDTGTVPPFTTAAGLWRRYELRGPDEPFELPQRWQNAQGVLPSDTPINFISDQHIIGGNSGSPVIDARARFVGLIFDGNRYSASWGSVYGNERGRSVSVDARYIGAALRTVYHAQWLVDQLEGK